MAPRLGASLSNYSRRFNAAKEASRQRLLAEKQATQAVGIMPTFIQLRLEVQDDTDAFLIPAECLLTDFVVSVEGAAEVELSVASHGLKTSYIWSHDPAEEKTAEFPEELLLAKGDLVKAKLLMGNNVYLAAVLHPLEGFKPFVPQESEDAESEDNRTLP